MEVTPHRGVTPQPDHPQQEPRPPGLPTPVASPPTQLLALGDGRVPAARLVALGFLPCWDPEVFRASLDDAFLAGFVLVLDVAPGSWPCFSSPTVEA